MYSMWCTQVIVDLKNEVMYVSTVRSVVPCISSLVALSHMWLAGCGLKLLRHIENRE